jgi:N-acyl-D-amino-acid deacylase
MKWLLVWCSALVVWGANYDLLIRNARVVDGTGNPWYRADVAVKDGRIAAIGHLKDATAVRTVDARGRVLTPGFIDVHTHVEGEIEKIPGADNYVRDGVTTIIAGNCGDSELDLGAWFAKLEKVGLGINLGSLTGHNDIRKKVMGTANRKATPDEMAQMRAIVERAMRDGGMGLSTGLIYIPGTYASTEEVLDLARVVARYDGIYTSHMRDEGAHVLEAIDEAVKVGRETGCRVELSHLKIDNRRRWGTSGENLALIEKFRREGVDVTVDQYPYDRSATNLFITLPSWALADGQEKIRERVADKATHTRIAAEMKKKLRMLGHKNYSYAMVSFCPSDHSLEGKTIPEIARLKGRGKKLRGQIETILEMVAQGWVGMSYHSMSMADVDRILRYPNTAVASDSGVPEFGNGRPHPRAYGTNARVFAEFVRARGVISIEDAVRRMTSLPARTFELRDRGLLREGFCADLVLFDPARVRDMATFQQPHQYSEGFDLVLVNGQAVFEEGKMTGARPGRILRHPVQ